MGTPTQHLLLSLFVHSRHCPGCWDRPRSSLVVADATADLAPSSSQTNPSARAAHSPTQKCDSFSTTPHFRARLWRADLNRRRACRSPWLRGSTSALGRNSRALPSSSDPYNGHRLPRDLNRRAVKVQREKSWRGSAMCSSDCREIERENVVVRAAGAWTRLDCGTFSANSLQQHAQSSGSVGIRPPRIRIVSSFINQPPAPI